MKILFLNLLLVTLIASCDNQPQDSSDADSDIPGIPDTHRPDRNHRRDDGPTPTDDPHAIKQKQMRARLREHRAILKNDLDALATDHQAYEWSEQHKNFVRWSLGSPMAKEAQEELRAGPKAIRDVVDELNRLKTNADFPKKNRDWKKVALEPANPYHKIYWDFLSSYRPGGDDDVVWDYDSIATSELRKAQEIANILDNPYTSKTSDYAVLKREIEKLSSEKKASSVRHGKLAERIKEIDETLDSNWDISQFKLEDLLKPIA